MPAYMCLEKCVIHAILVVLLYVLLLSSPGGGIMGFSAVSMVSSFEADEDRNDSVVVLGEKNKRLYSPSRLTDSLRYKAERGKSVLRNPS